MATVGDDFGKFPKDLGSRLEELISARTQLLQEVEAAERVQLSPGSSTWSVAEVVYHVHLSEKSIARMLKKALNSATRGAIADGEALRTEWERIRTLIGTRRARVQAPPRVLPTDPPNLTGAVELLKQSRQELLETVRNTNHDDLLAVSLPHPFQALGTLTGAGWLSVVAYHDLRHAEQIRELRMSVR